MFSMAAHASAEIDYFNDLFLSNGGKAISEMCKTVIFKNHCISIGFRAIYEIAKTVTFTKWLLSSGESTIFEFWKCSNVNKGYFPAGNVTQSQCLRMPPESARRDVRA